MCFPQPAFPTNDLVRNDSALTIAFPPWHTRADCVDQRIGSARWLRSEGIRRGFVGLPDDASPLRSLLFGPQFDIKPQSDGCGDVPKVAPSSR
jgi:hypothetical protein